MARLLWRGSFNTIDAHQDPNALHGLAIVASSFSLLAPHPSPFRTDEDDPFSTSSPIKADSNAELCLDLEMLRNRPLGVLRRVRLQSASLDATGDSESQNKLGKVHGRRGLKQSIEMLRKGKQKEAASEEIVQLGEGDNPEHTDNISLYIDERCPESIAYFNDAFCREEVDPASGRTRFGLLLSLVGNTVEDDLLDDTSSSNVRSTVVVYGRLQEHANASGRVLQLCVARQKDKKRQLGPRPDDPAPRENLFAQKLRRTVSQPAMTLTSSTGKSIATASAATSSAKRSSGPASSRQQQRPALTTSSSAPSHAQNASRILHRSKSSSLVGPSTSSSGGSSSGPSSSKARNPFSKSDNNGKKRSLSADADSSKAHLSPGRRGQKRPRLTAGGLKALQEEDGEDGHDAEAEQGDFTSRDRELSPTPSIASARSFQTAISTNTAITNGHGHANGHTKKPISRSLSMPPGQLDMARSRLGSRQPSEREGSVALTEVGDAKDEAGANSIAVRNKGTIRKVLLAEMILRKYARDHPDFTEVFAVTYKGVQCAFRRSIGKDKLDKEALQEIVRRHLEMYIPPR